MRKAGLIFTLLVVLSLSGTAQMLYKLDIHQDPEIIANAGNDTLLCKSHSITLGGNPTATGGTGEFYYQWSPPEFLDDNTSPNPICTPEATTTYLLTVTDGNGCSSHQFVRIQVDPCLGVGETPLDKSLVIYPNPATSNLTLAGFDPNLSEKIRIELINYLGKVVRRIEPEMDYGGSNFQISLEGINRGSYFIRVVTKGYAIIKSVEIQ